MALNMTEQDHEVRNLEDQLALRTRSLEDALAKVSQLKTEKATNVKKFEYWEGKIQAKDKEIQRLSGIIKALKDGLAKPSEAVAAKDAKIVELSAKIQTLKKRCEDERAETKRAKESAEASRALVDGFIMTQAEHKSQLVRLKRRIPCEEVDCPGEKECGFNHKMKEENKGQCKYFNYGKCDKSNECTFKHDIGARKLFHEEKKKLKEEKEKEGEKSKKEEKKDEGKGEKAKESTEPGNVKKKKKKKVNKEPKTEAKEGKSTSMETDEAPVLPPPDSDASAKTATQGQVHGAQGPQHSNTDARPPQHHAGNPLPPPQPQQQTSAPQQQETLFQPQIPTNFTFGQQQFPAAPPALTPVVSQPQAGNGFQGGASWQASWSGPSQMEMETQATASRKMRLDNLRMQLSNVQLRLMTVHSAPPGSVNVNDLLIEEMNLKKRLIEGNF